MDQAAFLGIETSLTGRRWQQVPADERLALTIAQRLGVPELVGRVMAGRGIDLETAQGYLTPTLRDSLPDPFVLKDMDKAVARLVRAVQDGETIAVFGDYDVDGATSSAVLLRFFRALDVPVLLHIPDRIAEGYGPNAPALLDLKRRGAGVVITVDCGATAFEPLAEAAAGGVEVIVCDHHVAEPRLPDAVAVVNPNRADEDRRYGHLAAVGVAFLLIVGINRGLRDAGWYTGRRAPDLLQWLDIVALGTVCDVVPLLEVNRALVAQGLKVMAKRGNPGIAALSDVGGVKERPEAYHLGYVLGPRVNAGGRVGQADLGARLLSTDDPLEAQALAQQLDGYNRARQDIEAEVLRQAIETVESRPDDGMPLLLLAGEDWHPGVIGIIAGRLKERYNRPACVVALEGAEGKGSGRSVLGLDLGSAVIAARQAGLLIKGGGHAMAAGFTVARDKLEALRQFLGERLAAQLAGPLVPVLELDGALEGVSLETVETLRQLGPFGAGNPEPKFALNGVRIIAPRVVGAGHVACQILCRTGARLKGIAFRSVDGELGQTLLRADGRPLALAGTVKIDNWGGASTVQMIIEDAGYPA